MFEKRYGRMDVDAILSGLKGRYGLSPEVMRLVEEDLCSGMTKEDVMKYCTKQVGIGRMRILSECVRKGLPEEVAEKLSGCEGHEENLEVAFELLDKGISIEKFEDALTDRDRLLNMLAGYAAGKLTSGEGKPQEGAKFEATRGTGDGGLSADELRGILSAFKEDLTSEIARAIAGLGDARDAEREELLQKLQAQLRDKDEMLVMQSRALTEARRTIAMLESRAGEKEPEKHARDEGGAGAPAEKPAGADAEGTTAGKTDEAGAEGAGRKDEEIPRRDGKGDESVKGKAEELTEGVLRITDGEGRVLCSAPVERQVRKPPAALNLCAMLGFKKKSQRSLMQMAIAGELCREQLECVAEAIRGGLTEAQLCSLIENKVPAEKMPQVIEIAKLENEMGYDNG
jgi:hypothetical protein